MLRHIGCLWVCERIDNAGDAQMNNTAVPGTTPGLLSIQLSLQLTGIVSIRLALPVFGTICLFSIFAGGRALSDSVSLMSTWNVSTFVLAAPPILRVDARELLCCGLQLLAEAI